MTRCACWSKCTNPVMWIYCLGQIYCTEHKNIHWHGHWRRLTPGERALLKSSVRAVRKRVTFAKKISKVEAVKILLNEG